MFALVKPINLEQAKEQQRNGYNRRTCTELLWWKRLSLHCIVSVDTDEQKRTKIRERNSTDLNPV